MSKTPDPPARGDGQPIPDMPEASGRAAVRGCYAGRVAPDARAHVFDTEAGIPPEAATARDLAMPPRRAA